MNKIGFQLLVEFVLVDCFLLCDDSKPYNGLGAWNAPLIPQHRALFFFLFLGQFDIKSFNNKQVTCLTLFRVFHFRSDCSHTWPTESEGNLIGGRGVSGSVWDHSPSPPVAQVEDSSCSGVHYIHYLTPFPPPLTVHLLTLSHCYVPFLPLHLSKVWQKYQCSHFVCDCACYE